MSAIPQNATSFRQEGNRLYQRAHAEGNSLYIRKVLLSKAIVAYEKAIPPAHGDEDERASIDKNLGLAHYALSSLDHLPPTEIAEHKRDALMYMSAALKRVKIGATKKDAGWSTKVEELFQKILDSGVEKVADLAREARKSKDAKDEKEEEEEEERRIRW